MFDQPLDRLFLLDNSYFFDFESIVGRSMKKSIHGVFENIFRADKAF